MLSSSVGSMKSISRIMIDSGPFSVIFVLFFPQSRTEISCRLYITLVYLSHAISGGGINKSALLRSDSQLHLFVVKGVGFLAIFVHFIELQNVVMAMIRPNKQKKLFYQPDRPSFGQLWLFFKSGFEKKVRLPNFVYMCMCKKTIFCLA